MPDPTAAIPPRDLHELRSLIVRKRDAFTKSAETVARFAFAHPDDMAFLSEPKIADLCGVSRATVRRAVGFLGFASYRDFRELFRQQLRRRTSRPILGTASLDAGQAPRIGQRSEPYLSDLGHA